MARRPDKDKLARGKTPLRERSRSASLPSKDAPAPQKTRAWYSFASIRDAVENLAVALIFAFLLRTFAVEAFVIPTGSMATTLLGRHKDVSCPKCGYPFQVNAGQELDKTGAPTGTAVIGGTCPMCRFTMDLGRGNTAGQEYSSYSGDRIMASRSSYLLKPPQRWDVTVFHFPLGAEENYIKRLIGLPQETVRIHQGDIWIQPQGAQAFSIARKPPEKVLATMRPVYDNDYVQPEPLRQGGWPARWTSLSAEAWKPSDDQKSFRTEGTASGEAWLGYRHVVPSYGDWFALTSPSARRSLVPKPQLITDFLAYDTEYRWPPERPPEGRFFSPRPAPLPGGLGQPPYPYTLGMNWVGDLIVEFTVQSSAARGELLVELVKGGKPFLCRLDLEKGTADLQLPGASAAPHSAAGLRAAGQHTVRLANVDQQLLLWLDGRLVPFDAPTSYESEQVDTSQPNQEDLVPVRIGSRGASLEVSHLKIFRDIYYVAVQSPSEHSPPPLMTDFPTSDPQFPFKQYSADEIRSFFTEPSRWAIFARRQQVAFPLGADQYFMLGDNSTESLDGRLWGTDQYFVPGDLLIGRAVLLYWPHSWHRIPGTSIPFPYFPNFSRMGRIH